MKSAFSFLPRGFGSLIDYISPSAFDVIDWTAALKKSASLTKELVFETSVKRLKEQFFPFLPDGINFSEIKSAPKVVNKVDGQNNTNESAKEIPSDSRYFRGQKLLEIYFLQIHVGQEVFLDLRKERFSAPNNSDFTWSPNGLWYKFSSDFMNGMRDIYTGFYRDSEESLQAGLSKLGLVSDSMSSEARAELRSLLEAHFGQGKSAPMKFSVAHFMSSFDSLFLFLKKHKLKLSEDFLFLGIYILTLYLHLENLGEAFDVAQAFEIATNKRISL